MKLKVKILEKRIDVPVDEIKPDPNQPRKYFDRERIKEMADSIKTAGIINPIEIDQNNIIVTGETRWRAAKLAGFDTVPCTIISLNKIDRFFRQGIENIHHGTMTGDEVGKMLVKMLKSLANSPGELARGKFHEGERYQKGIKELSGIIGMSVGGIIEYLAVNESSKAFRRAVAKRKISYTHIRAIQLIENPKFAREFEQKIAKGGIKTRDASIALAKAMNLVPKAAPKLLKTNFSKLGTEQVREKIREIIPGYSETPTTDIIEEGKKLALDLLANIHRVTSYLKKYSPTTIGTIHFWPIVVALRALMRAADSWAKNQPEGLSPKIQDKIKAIEREGG